MKEPVDHIARSILPWRPQERGLTECGLDAASYSTLSREHYFARVKDLGKTRAAMVTCVTCSQTTERWRPWESDPVDAMKRETEKYWGGGQAPGPGASAAVLASYEHWARFRHELRSIAALIEEHREEFDAHLSAFGDVVKLEEARAARRDRIKQPKSKQWGKW